MTTRKTAKIPSKRYFYASYVSKQEWTASYCRGCEIIGIIEEKNAEYIVFTNDFYFSYKNQYYISIETVTKETRKDIENAIYRGMVFGFVDLTKSGYTFMRGDKT
jgi:hypothetical protein